MLPYRSGSAQAVIDQLLKAFPLASLNLIAVEHRSRSAIAAWSEFATKGCATDSLEKKA